jgi:hypothetical protein
VISKTVVKVENADGSFKNLDRSSIKTMPANSSLNLMIEKYTVRRDMENSTPSFFVTVESFQAQMDNLQFRLPAADSDNSTETYLTDDDYEFLKSYLKDNAVLTSKKTFSRPL